MLAGAHCRPCCTLVPVSERRVRHTYELPLCGCAGAPSRFTPQDNLGLPMYIFSQGAVETEGSDGPWPVGTNRSCGGILRSHHSVMRITACTWHLYRAMVLSDPQLSLKQNMEQDTESPCSCHRVPCHLAVTAHHSLPERMPWRIVTKSPRIVGKW